ncbi:MAG: hypothetical protein HKO59_14435 [Phycisphaerales bacterium]|nr:hypothetical protein [Phycisphaerae bacterium]NNF42455.1 hypothetical protein [Phycisphaerales bacterium]NNM27158.1 hypothetical protein [Phycisphaerales bacterium]
MATPRWCGEPWPDIRARAIAEDAPLFMPVQPHADDRGWSYMNLFAGALEATGQVNFSVQNPGVVKAWRCHEHQTDFWCCLNGHVKAGVYRATDQQCWAQVMGDRCPGVLVIPPGLWHGRSVVGTTPAGVLSYVDQTYDAVCPDEQRRPADCVPGFPWHADPR